MDWIVRRTLHTLAIADRGQTSDLMREARSFTLAEIIPVSSFFSTLKSLEHVTIGDLLTFL